MASISMCAQQGLHIKQSMNSKRPHALSSARVARVDRRACARRVQTVSMSVSRGSEVRLVVALR
eukprot:6806885-Pyramimonas_sp.AAC.1